MAACPNCGRQVGAAARFCANCGQDMSVSVPQDQRIQTENVNVPPPPQSTRGRFGCGRILLLGCGGLIALVVLMGIIGAVVGGGNDTSQTSSSSSSPSPSPSPSPPSADSATASPASSPKYIPGLSGSGLQAQLEDRGFTCTFSKDVAPGDPEGKGPIGSGYSCTSAPTTGAVDIRGTVEVTIHNYSGDKVDEITGTVYGPKTEDLSGLATIKYDDAQPEQAKQWFNDNVGLVAFQAPRSTQFGSAKFELSGNPPNAYILDVYAPGLDD